MEYWSNGVVNLETPLQYSNLQHSQNNWGFQLLLIINTNLNQKYEQRKMDYC